eukprot:977976-Amorphochlora_amoeboformis.AAC.1
MYEAILTLFQVATLSGWNVIMYYSIDAVGIDQQPQRNHQPAWGILYILFIFLCSFFAMNLFIAVLIDKFNKLYEQLNGSAFLTAAQRKWNKFYKLASATKLRKSVAPPKFMPSRLSLEVVGQPSAEGGKFEIFILSCIVLNAFVSCLHHYQEPQALSDFIFYMNIIFNSIFTLEVMFKLLAWGYIIYFSDGWNIFDFLVVFISLASYGLDGVGSFSALRLFRLARLFRMFAKIPMIRALFETLILSSSSLINVGALILVIFYIYAVLGVFLFGKVAWVDGGLSQYANFATFPSAMITLWRMATGDAWEEIQWGIQISETSGQCSRAAGNCGYEWACIYTISFMIFVGLVMVNLFIAVILEGFGESANEDQEYVLHLNKWRDMWNELDPQATGILPAYEVANLVTKFPRPIGLDLQDEPLSAISRIRILDHFGTNLPLRIYKAPVIPADKLHHHETVSPFTLSTKYTNPLNCGNTVHPCNPRQARYIWVCQYEDTLRSIARAMFDDFSEEDARTLMEEHFKS